MDSINEEDKSTAFCYICQHKNDNVDASYVCKQCRIFLCATCSTRHINLPGSKDHIIIELGRVLGEHDIPQTKAREANKENTETDNIIVDSDYECHEDLSTFLNAPEDATLCLVSNANVQNEMQKMFCLADGRICIQASNKILVYSKEYAYQFATNCSSSCAVVPTDGNTIAILDYYLTIRRLNITEKEAKLIDNVPLDIPSRMFEKEATIQYLCGKDKSYPAFSYGDGEYTLVFYGLENSRFEMAPNGLLTVRSEIQPAIRCSFNTNGQLLRRVNLDIKDPLKRIICLHNEYQTLDIIDRKDSERNYIDTSGQYILTSTIRILRFNRYGGKEKDYSLSADFSSACPFCDFSSASVFCDGSHFLIHRNQSFTVLETKTLMQREFQLSQVDVWTPNLVTYQKCLNRIIASPNSCTLLVFGLMKKNEQT